MTDSSPDLDSAHTVASERKVPRTMFDGNRPLELAPSESLHSVFVRRFTSHPNIFRKRIERIEGNPLPGDWVAVYCLEPNARRTDSDSSAPYQKPSTSQNKGADPAPTLFGYGIYNSKSEVAVRLYSWNAELPTNVFWNRKFVEAVSLRRDLLGLDATTNAYRVLHGESDNTPGLVVDRYGDCLSAEAFSLGMYQRAESIMEKLSAQLGTKHYLIQPSPQFLSQEGYQVDIVKSPELPPYVTIMENGVQFRVHFGTGHKTGFFCDQRDNRITLAKHTSGKSVLDLCCYSGGFAISAAKAGGASEVTAVDLDEEAIATAKKNAAINQTRVRLVHADAFAFMRDMIRNGKQFDVVVLDPPKLIRSRLELEEGSRKHFDLNRLAIQLVRSGGLLLTCSCAGLLSNDEFQRIVQSAARSSGYSETGERLPGRTVQIIESRGAAPDHPVAVHCPETGYLKAFWARVL